ncbi:MAG TPA: hypothetical protein VER35_02295 [Candidatus Limnocylindrales bacterium]|nr:hypothetical protein [Candidatus Limnocylindrales bacterium]
MNILINSAPIRQGDFHNIAFLLFATAAALVLRLAGIEVRGFVPVRGECLWGAYFW